MLMRWIAAAGVRRVARDQAAAKFIPASGEIAASTRFSCGDRRRGRRRARTVAPRRPWRDRDAGGRSAKPSPTRLSARRRRASVAHPYRRRWGAAQGLDGSDAGLFEVTRGIGVAPSARGRSAA